MRVLKKKKTQDGDCEPRWYRGVWLRWRWLILVQMEISEEQVYGGKDCIWFDDQVVHTQEYPWGEEIHVSIMHAVKCYRPLEHWALKCINSVLTHAAAAAAAKWSQSRLTLCDPTDSSPPGCSIPGILQSRILKWVAISVSNAWKWKVKVKSLSRVRLFETPWTAAYQALSSMGFSRQEYWSGVPCSSLTDVWVTIKYTPDFKDFIQGKECKIVH